MRGSQQGLLPAPHTAAHVWWLQLEDDIFTTTGGKEVGPYLALFPQFKKNKALQNQVGPATGTSGGAW